MNATTTTPENQPSEDPSAAPRIRLPSAEELDTGGKRQDFQVRLYLVPTAEARGEENVPLVTTHCGVGNIGTPESAYHGRWLSLGSYGAEIVGQSVRDFLEAHADHLCALAGSYAGSDWDGHNRVGRWSEDRDDLQAELGHIWSEARRLDEIKAYWTADDWYGASGMGWLELCRDAQIDPELALRDDWEAAVATVVARERESADEIVSGVEAYVRQTALDYREESEEAR